MNTNVLFESKSTSFHFWPFDYDGWRGFFTKNHVVITEDEITVECWPSQKTFKIEDVEFCNEKKRWFGYANSQLSIGVNNPNWQIEGEYKKEYDKLLKIERENEENKDEASDTENAKKHGWIYKIFYFKDGRCYLPSKEIAKIRQLLKERNAICFREGNIVIGRGNKALWINNEHTITRDDCLFRGIQTKDIEFAAPKRRCWGLLRPKFSVGSACWYNFKYNWVNFWVLNVKATYDEIKTARDILKKKEAICYKEGSSVVTTTVPLWCIWSRLFSDKDSLWMNPEHVISDRRIGWLHHGIIIPQIKFFYTKGLFSHDLYLGAKGTIRLDNISSKDKTTIEQHLKENGAKIALDSIADYNDVFTLGDIFKVKNWFVSSTISITKNGIKMTQKTFKTNDNIFLPYDKINFAETYGGHSLLGARHIRIYGEQHIMPIRKYSKSATKEILKCLDEHGIHAVKGEKFTPSYHSSWIGILLSIVTLSIWHWIVVFFTSSKKRNGLTLDATQKKASWEGPLYVVWKEKNEDPKKDDGSKLTFEVSDLEGIIYYKKHWYHLWGYLCLNVHPYSFRNDQMSKDYTFLLGKCWSWKAKYAISQFVECGHKRDYSGSLKKNMKWWTKYILNKMS